MERVELLEALNTTKAGLSVNDLIPVLTHYCFTEKALTTYNDYIGITVPLDAGFTGAVPGAIMRAIIESMAYSTIELREVDGELRIQAGKKQKTMGRLTMMPTKEFTDLFTFPKPKGDPIPVKMPELVEALTACLRSAKDDAAQPEQMGVTVLGREGHLSCFATDGATLSNAKVKVPNNYKGPERAILPTLFCKQLIALADKDSTLELHSDYALLTFGKAMRLFGRLVRTDNPLDLEGTLAKHYNDKIRKRMVVMPERLASVLDRAIIITEGPSRDTFSRMKEISKVGQTKTRIEVVDGIATFFSKSLRGEMTDTVPVDQKPSKEHNLSAVDHPDCPRITIDPGRVQDGIKHYDKFLITDSAIIMANKYAAYLVSASMVKEDS